MGLGKAQRWATPPVRDRCHAPVRDDTFRTRLEREPVNVTKMSFVVGSAVLAAIALASFADPAQAVVYPVTQTPVAACSAAVHNPKGVLWIGDSITASGYSDITARLGRLGHPVCVNGQPGRSTAQGVAVLRQYIRSGLIAPTVIMALGTNDASADVLVPDFGCQVNNAMFAVGRNRRVYWINVYNGLSAGTVQQSSNINAQLVTQDRAHTNLAKSEWFLYVSNRLYLLQSDQVHPTGLGNSVRTVNLENDAWGYAPLWTRLLGEATTYRTCAF